MHKNYHSGQGTHQEMGLDRFGFKGELNDQQWQSNAIRGNQKGQVGSRVSSSGSNSLTAAHGQPTNASPRKGGQWATQTASTRYMSSSSQNFIDNDAPRIEQAQMLDFVPGQAADEFMNMVNN